MTSPAAGRPLLTATRLTKTHHTGAGQVPALHDVSFDLDQGTFYVLTGPRWLVSFAAWRRCSFLITREIGWVAGVER